MRILKLFSVLIFVAFVPSGLAPKDSGSWEEKRVEIAGRVLNFDQHQDHQTIQFHFQDLLDRRKKLTASINEDGTFKTEALLAYSQEFYLQYGKLATLFCSPGDSLFLEVDADIWNKREAVLPNGKFFVQMIGGTATKINQNIIKFLKELPDDKSRGNTYIAALQSKSPEAYIEHITQREKEYRAFLSRFNKTNKTDKQFKRWADDRLKYESWNDLMRYPWENPYRNHMPEDSLKLPPAYFSFLENYDMNDMGVITIPHGEFLHELLKYLHRRSLASAAATSAKGSDSDFAKNLVRSIRQSTSGFTQQLVLSYVFYLYLGAHKVTPFEEGYEPGLITNPHLKKRVEVEYKNQKAYLANQNTQGANLPSIGNSATPDLLQNITSRYKNKVIYIDFWGPWCGPCMQEMPSSKEMQEHFKDREVVFLFLSIRTKEEAWKATIANKGLTGEHINLTNDQFNVLESALGIGGVPHYTLIDKKGDIFLKAAPRPSEKEALKKEIESLLKE